MLSFFLSFFFPAVPFSVLCVVLRIPQEYFISLHYLSLCASPRFCPRVLRAFHSSPLPELPLTALHRAAGSANELCCSERAWPYVVWRIPVCLVIPIPTIPPKRGNCAEALGKWLRCRGRRPCGAGAAHHTCGSMQEGSQQGDPSMMLGQLAGGKLVIDSLLMCTSQQMTLRS